MEKWRIIKEFPSYEVGNKGNVRRNHGGIISMKSPSPNKRRGNYLYVSLQERNRKRTISVHRLVAIHFIPNPRKKRQVNHIDFNVSNNNVENLEWCSPKENSTHSKLHGRTKAPRGEDCTRSVLKESIVLNIIRERIKKFTSYKKLAKIYKTNYSNIAHIMRKSRWAFIWDKYGIRHDNRLLNRPGRNKSSRD